MARWIENPYWQFVCGEGFFQHRFPVNPSQLSRWRKRIGPEDCEKMLRLTIDAGSTSKTVQPKCFEKIIVDTTVQPKGVAHPTDARLYHKTLTVLVRIANAVMTKTGIFGLVYCTIRARVAPLHPGIGLPYPTGNELSPGGTEGSGSQSP